MEQELELERELEREQERKRERKRKRERERELELERELEQEQELELELERKRERERKRKRELERELELERERIMSNVLKQLSPDHPYRRGTQYDLLMRYMPSRYTSLRDIVTIVQEDFPLFNAAGAKIFMRRLVDCNCVDRRTVSSRFVEYRRAQPKGYEP